MELGLTRALLLWLAVLKQRRREHDPGREIRDLAVASDSIAFRVIDRIASDPWLPDA